MVSKTKPPCVDKPVAYLQWGMSLLVHLDDADLFESVAHFLNCGIFFPPKVSLLYHISMKSLGRLLLSQLHCCTGSPVFVRTGWWRSWLVDNKCIIATLSDPPLVLVCQNGIGWPPANKPKGGQGVCFWGTMWDTAWRGGGMAPQPRGQTHQ